MGVGVIIPAPVGVRNPDDQGIDAFEGGQDRRAVAISDAPGPGHRVADGWHVIRVQPPIGPRALNRLLFESVVRKVFLAWLIGTEICHFGSVLIL
jgi:hypothetical protein